MKNYNKSKRLMFKGILFFSVFIGTLYSEETVKAPGMTENKVDSSELLYFQPNTTPLFTELYQAYGLDPLPQKTFFDDAIYLDQSTPVTILPLQPSNQKVFGEASDVLEKFHKRVGDFELYVEPNKPKPFFYTASGSKHLIVALVYAIAMSEPNKKFVFVEEAPFYSGHPSAVANICPYPNARFLKFHDPSEIKLEPGEELVEFVTSPNNPDGKFRKPLTAARIILADFVFASSAFGSDESGYLEGNLEWIKQARADGKHVFSFNSSSKQFGKTGCRVGYIWYPLYDSYAESIFHKFFGYISASTVAGGTVGLAHFLDLIKAFNDLPDNAKALRYDAKRSLKARHALMEKEFLNRYPGSLVTSIPGSPTFFAKVQDKRIPAKNASEVLLADLNVSVNNGDTMGESKDFIRLNLCGNSEPFAELLNRLAQQKKYTKNDVIFISNRKPALQK